MLPDAAERDALAYDERTPPTSPGSTHTWAHGATNEFEDES